MKIIATLIAVVALVSGAIALDNASNSTAATMAVADSSRPDTDTARDADRKPAQTLEFAGIKPGDKVADYVADQGYFTRLFANVVGSNGHVYAVEPTAFFKFEHFVKEVAELQGYAVAHPNVTVTTAAALEGAKFPEKLDLFWISRNYHDLHDQFMGPVDTAAFNKAVYSALKPGGVYVILDHSAAPGAAAGVTETLHRIESSTVRREVEAAGFKFDSESSILANPADPRTAKVFDQTIRGHTDQFILKFRKPGAENPAKPRNKEGRASEATSGQSRLFLTTVHSHYRAGRRSGIHRFSSNRIPRMCAELERGRQSCRLDSNAFASVVSQPLFLCRRS